MKQQFGDEYYGARENDDEFVEMVKSGNIVVDEEEVICRMDEYYDLYLVRYRTFRTTFTTTIMKVVRAIS